MNNLLKEDFKTWDYHILDEFVYAGEPTSGKRLVKNGYIERYLHSELYCYCIVRYGDFDSHIVIEAFTGSIDTTRHIAHADNRTWEARDNFPMFINTVNFVEPPKDFRWKPIRSIVRLKTFNNRTGIDRNINQFSACPTAFIVEITLSVEDGEFRTSSRLVGGEQCKLPGQMVKAGTEVIGNLSDKQPPFLRGFPNDLKIEDIGNLFRLALWDDLAWFGFQCQKQTDFPMKYFELFLCPDDFELDTIERMHMLYSTYGRQENGHTKNPKGFRDTNPEAQGHVRHTRKGNKTDQAISSPPLPEEVTSQTAPSCHCGDYTAKHIHSGSLEDV